MPEMGSSTNEGSGNTTNQAAPVAGSPEPRQRNVVKDVVKGLDRLHVIMGLQCNVRCSMCYQTDFSPKRNMPAAIYRDRLSQLFPSVRTIIMSGGEPTIMANCRDLATLLRRTPSVRLTLTTNGVRVDDFWLETFVQQSNNLNFSINAASEQAYRKIVAFGDYQRVLQNVAKVAERRSGKEPFLSISAVVLRENVLEMADFVRLGKRLGVDGVQFLTDPLLSFTGLPDPKKVLAEIQRADEARQETGLKVGGLANFGRRFGFAGGDEAPAKARAKVCPVPFQHSVIDANGNVRVCCNTWEPVGNLYASSFEEIWNGVPLRRWRERLSRGDYSRCEPCCTDNPSPSRYALAHKYSWLALHDPRYFATKVERKLQQIIKARGRGSEES